MPLLVFWINILKGQHISTYVMDSYRLKCNHHLQWHEAKCTTDM